MNDRDRRRIAHPHVVHVCKMQVSTWVFIYIYMYVLYSTCSIVQIVCIAANS